MQMYVQEMGENDFFQPTWTIPATTPGNLGGKYRPPFCQYLRNGAAMIGWLRYALLPTVFPFSMRDKFLFVLVGSLSPFLVFLNSWSCSTPQLSTRRLANIHANRSNMAPWSFTKHFWTIWNIVKPSWMVFFMTTYRCRIFKCCLIISWVITIRVRLVLMKNRHPASTWVKKTNWQLLLDGHSNWYHKKGNSGRLTRYMRFPCIYS